MTDPLDTALVALVAFVVVVVLMVLGGVARQLQAERACLRLGYPTAKLTWTLDAYCVKRVDQTDVVTLLGAP